MEITTYEHDGQGTKHYRGLDPMIQALLGCFGSVRRPETPPELPANVVPYPKQSGPRVTMPLAEPASVELCPSAAAHPRMSIATLLSDAERAGVRVDVKGVRRTTKR